MSSEESDIRVDTFLQRIGAASKPRQRKPTYTCSSCGKKLTKLEVQKQLLLQVKDLYCSYPCLLKNYQPYTCNTCKYRGPIQDESTRFTAYLTHLAKDRSFISCSRPLSNRGHVKASLPTAEMRIHAQRSLASHPEISAVMMDYNQKPWNYPYVFDPEMVLACSNYCKGEPQTQRSPYGRSSNNHLFDIRDLLDTTSSMVNATIERRADQESITGRKQP